MSLEEIWPCTSHLEDLEELCTGVLWLIKTTCGDLSVRDSRVPTRPGWVGRQAGYCPGHCPRQLRRLRRYVAVSINLVCLVSVLLEL